MVNPALDGYLSRSRMTGGEGPFAGTWLAREPAVPARSGSLQKSTSSSEFIGDLRGQRSLS